MDSGSMALLTVPVAAGEEATGCCILTALTPRSHTILATPFTGLLIFSGNAWPSGRLPRWSQSNPPMGALEVASTWSALPQRATGLHSHLFQVSQKVRTTSQTNFSNSLYPKYSLSPTLLYLNTQHHLTVNHAFSIPSNNHCLSVCP